MRSWLLGFALAFGGCAGSDPPAAAIETDARIVAQTVDPLIESEMRRSGIPGAAFIFVRHGRVIYQRGYGLSDIARATPVDPEATVWPIASITKVITALSVMQLVAEGRLDLDADINESLRRLQVPSQGHGPLTLRHLLSHTSGLDELPGRQFETAEPPDMAEFLRGRLVRYRAPGVTTAYSSYGMWLAGLLVEEASGETYDDYVREHILAPAGMRRSWIMARRGDERGVATPYQVEDGQARPLPYEFYVSRPTSSMVASAGDMGRLLIALRDGERRRGSRLLAPRWLHPMMTEQATIHPAIPGWGLGFQLDRVNGRAIAEHGGDIGGFSALLVVLPEEDAGFFIVNHGEGTDLRFAVKQALLDRLLPAVPTTVPTPNPADSARLAEYAGPYLNTLACRTCRDRAEQPFELTVGADGTLRLWGQRWIPLGRDLFIREDGRRTLGFSRDPTGRIMSVSAGSWRVGDRIWSESTTLERHVIEGDPGLAI